MENPKLVECVAGNADDTLQILDLANLDVSLNIAPATVSGSSNTSSSKSMLINDKTGKELSCYTTDFSSCDVMDMAFVGSALDQSSIVVEEPEQSIIETKSDEVTDSKVKDQEQNQDEGQDVIEEFTEAPSVLPINTDDFLVENKTADLIEIGDLIQLSDSSIDPDVCESNDRSICEFETVQSKTIDMVTDTIAEDIELIKFDDSIQLKSEPEKDNVIILISEDGEESKELSNSSSTEFPKENYSNEDEENRQVGSSYDDNDEVFCSENGQGEVEENEQESGEVKLLDITNFVFSSPAPPTERNKSLGNNSSLNLMDMSLSKLSKDENKDKFSTPKPCLKFSSNTSGDDGSVSNTTSYSRRKSKSVSFQSPGIYFSNVKRLSVIRKTPIRRSINRTTGKTTKTPDSAIFNKMVKFSTPNKIFTTPSASPFTTMVNKFSRLALATPPTSKMNESRPLNEEFSSINLVLSESCESDKSENSTKCDTSEQCIRI